MIRVSRGMFNTGVHLLMSTSGEPGWSITARLQEGKRYLDADRDVLFSRYGLSSQQWTVLGTIGHYSVKPEATSVGDAKFITNDNRIDRVKFVENMNALMSYAATQGFSDSPAYPGFSVIPIAVYRPIPKT